MKTSLALFAFCALVSFAFGQTNNPKYPTWWSKYQCLSKHGTNGNGGTFTSISWKAMSMHPTNAAR